MAIRNVRVESDPILRKISKEVVDINDNVLNLVDDMIDTMIKYDGVGIAAVQVGILKRIVIVDVPTDDGMSQPQEMINPVILERSKEEESGVEGCLSIPGYIGKVSRPIKVVVKYTDRFGKEHVETFENLGARIVSHELDHLDGKLYVDSATEVSELNDDISE